MASVQVTLTKGVWTQLTTANNDGSIKHRRGNTKIVYLEATSAPVGFNSSIPVMEETRKGEGFTFWGVSNEDFIFAYAINSDADITISAKGA